MAAVATALLQPADTRGQVQFIMDDKNRLRRDFEKSSHGTHRLTTEVHKGGRVEQANFPSADKYPGSQTREFLLWLQDRSMVSCQLLDVPEAGIMTGVFVLCPRITQANNQSN